MLQSGVVEEEREVIADRRALHKSYEAMQGTILEIHIADEPSGPTRPVSEVRAVPERGLEGDRYYNMIGTFSGEEHQHDNEVTLIEMENVEAFNSEHGTALTAADTRRNIVTRGVRLNDLKEREFTIGDVRFLGHGLCEPCTHLQKLTDNRVLPGFVGRCGLRAQVLADGVIRVGDVIEG
jgi:MOSC domain-containing protein YiiM